MDAFLLTQALSKKENFDDGPERVMIVKETQGFSFLRMFQFVLSTAISVYAAYLSWSCSAGEHMSIRVLSAMFAFLFGVLYILYFALVRSSSCKLY